MLKMYVRRDSRVFKNVHRDSRVFKYVRRGCKWNVLWAINFNSIGLNFKRIIRLEICDPVTFDLKPRIFMLLVVEKMSWLVFHANIGCQDCRAFSGSFNLSAELILPTEFLWTRHSLFYWQWDNQYIGFSAVFLIVILITQCQCYNVIFMLLSRVVTPFFFLWCLIVELVG